MQAFSELIDDLAPTIFATLDITLDELLNCTLKDLFYRMDGANLKRRVFLSELETMWIAYTGYPLYASNSKKKIKINNMLKNRIYTINPHMSVSKAKSIMEDVQLLKETGVIK